MKEFSNKIMIVAANEVPTIIAFPFSEFKELHSNIEVSPKIEEKTTDAGPTFNFSLRTTHNEIDNETQLLLQNHRPVVLLLFDDSGNFYQIGTEHIPVLVLNNTINFNGELKFEGNFIEQPF